MNKNEYIKWLKEMLSEEDETITNSTPNHIIYIIDDVLVFGGFEGNIRSIDHNFLLNDSVSRKDLIEWGTIVVPETKVYVATTEIPILEHIGYERQEKYLL